MTGVIVKPADPAFRRAVLKGIRAQPQAEHQLPGKPQASGKPPLRPRKGSRTAVIVGFGDGTFAVRLLAFNRVALEAIKAAPTRRLRWDERDRQWLGWTPADRERVHERLESLGYDVSARGAG